MKATIKNGLPFLAVVLALSSLGAQDTGILAGEPADPEAEAAKRFQAYAKEQATTYEIRVGSAEGRKLVPADEPILRWANPLGGRKAHGDVFLWTDEGCPAAVLSLYEYTDKDGRVHEHHEFCSLATTALVTEGPGNRNWSPKVGLTFTPLPDSPEPAQTPARRLVQMRELAGRFTCEKTTREGETRDLRLLRQPALRYESKAHQVADGALFSLVEATDPEVLLLIEARPTAGQPRWHYALARMNSIRLAASLGERKVWEADVLPWRDALNRTDLPYTAFTIR